jgi:chorismate synthase
MLRFLTAGESHGPCLTAIIEGLPAGLPVDAVAINKDLQRRQSGYGRGARMRIEHDEVELVGGLTGGKTTAGPLCLRIGNLDYVNWRDKALETLTVPRPGHADLAGELKYHHHDLRIVLERSSARETAARVAVGSVARALLLVLGIQVGSHVTAIGGIPSSCDELAVTEAWRRAEESPVRCPDSSASVRMCQRIDRARDDGDSLGGVFVVTALGVPAGLGSYVHWDRRLDGQLACALMSIPGVKGVEIGPAFENAGLPGTQVHDPILPGQPIPSRPSNRAGGTEGGVSNGMPIVLRAAMKPIPTLTKGLPSIDLTSGCAVPATYQRSDVCAAPAAAVVGEAMVAWVLAQSLTEKLGGDSLQEMIDRWHAWVSSLSLPWQIEQP